MAGANLLILFLISRGKHSFSSKQNSSCGLSVDALYWVRNLTSITEYFYYKRMLDFIKYYFVYWSEHVIFALCSINTEYYNDLLLDIKPTVPGLNFTQSQRIILFSYVAGFGSLIFYWGLLHLYSEGIRFMVFLWCL